MAGLFGHRVNGGVRVHLDGIPHFLYLWGGGPQGRWRAFGDLAGFTFLGKEVCGRFLAEQVTLGLCR